MRNFLNRRAIHHSQHANRLGNSTRSLLIYRDMFGLHPIDSGFQQEKAVLTWGQLSVREQAVYLHLLRQVLQALARHSL